MTLIDADAADALYAAMPPAQETSGGSAANTCAVAAGLGARVAYLGKVADDQLGGVFRHDIAAAGVHFPTAPLVGGAPTARCLILVTPDGQRTMNTYLGACVGVRRGATWTRRLVARRRCTYLEGYLFDPPAAQAAFRRAAAAAHAAGRQVALSLSDAFCVDRHRAAFRELVAGDIDILFANEAEICSLYEVQRASRTRPTQARQRRRAGRADPQRGRQRDRSGATRRSRSRPRPPRWSTPPAPATPTPPASWPPSPPAARCAPAAGWAASPPPRSSAITAPARSATCALELAGLTV